MYLGACLHEDERARRQRRGILRWTSFRRTRGARGVQLEATSGSNTGPQVPGRVGCVTGTTRHEEGAEGAVKVLSCHAGGSCTALVHDLLKVVSIWTNNRESLKANCSHSGSTYRVGGVLSIKGFIVASQKPRTHELILMSRSVPFRTARATYTVYGNADHGRPK